MKICIVTAALKHGGASIIALDVARGMSQRGHEVLFVCSGDSAKSYEKDGYRIEVLELKKQISLYHYFNPLLLRSFGKLLSNFKPDIIHVHNINLQTFSLGALLFSRKYPMVWTLHDVWAICMVGWPNPPDCSGLINECEHCVFWPKLIVFLNRFIKKNVFRYSRFSIVSPSEWLASLLRRNKIIDKLVYKIRNGVDQTIFFPVAERYRDTNISNHGNKKTILFIGGKRLSGRLPAWRKGWEYLFKALEILGRKRADIQLLYIGDPIDIPSTFPVLVTFVTDVDREMMNSYYSAADLMVLPTLADNAALTILEAMACRTPVIATNTGGVAEVVIPFKTGLLCPPRDVNKLVEAIEWSFSNPEETDKMVTQAQNMIFDEFSFSLMINKYESVYRRTIEER
jgi:glycosyltransferase involved in cell wall biosynthesis